MAPSMPCALLLAVFLGAPAVAVSEPNGVRKVITLLQEMTAQVSKESQEDAEAYDKFKCWCITSEKEKTAAVDAAKQRIAELEAFLVEAAGLIGELKTNIEATKQEIAEDNDSLDTATKQREEDAAAFAKEEADLKECIGALKEAVAVLRKAQLLQKKGTPLAEAVKKAQPALLQLQRLANNPSSYLARAAQFRDVMQRDLFDALSTLDDSAGGKFLPRPRLSALSQQSRLLPWEKTEEQEGMEANPNELEGQAAGAKSYNSRTGGVVGILTQMLDEFTKSLGVAQKSELEALAAFQKLKAAKLAEIASATKLLESYEYRLSETIEKKAQAKEDLAAFIEALSADEKFLADLDENCASADAEYSARSKARGEELRALNEVITMLSSDDARDLFGKTLALLQISSVADAAAAGKGGQQQELEQHRAVQQAVRNILRAAHKNKDWVLASLAVRTKLDTFAKVREMIDKMLVELQAQQKAEYEKVELCKKELDATEDQAKEAEIARSDLEEKKLGLDNSIATLTSDIAGLNEDIAEMEVSMKRAGEDRKAENQVFQSAVSDQRATVQILKKAAARLAEFYSKTAALQVGGKVAPPPPKGSGDYQKSAGAGGVMQVLQMVIEDVERSEAVMVADEQHAQESYATFARDATASIEANREAVAGKQQQKASAEGALSETDGEILSNAAELAKLDELLNGLHLGCDFLLKYFDVRQAARKEEMDAIVQAKAILAGADFGGK